MSIILSAPWVKRQPSTQRSNMHLRQSMNSLIFKHDNIRIAPQLASPALSRAKKKTRNGTTQSTVSKSGRFNTNNERLIYVTSAFQDLRQSSISLGHRLLQHGPLSAPPLVGTHRTVALLCSSSIDFLFAWLALMRLGYSVLLIAYVDDSSS